MSSPFLAEPPAAVLTAVDELGQLEAEISPFAMKIARVEALRKQIREAYALQPPEQSFTLSSRKFVVELGARSRESKVNVPKLAKLVGVKVLHKIASVTLKALESAVSQDVMNQVVSYAQTGTRSLKVMERG